MKKYSYDIKTKQGKYEDLTAEEVAYQNAWNASATDRKKDEVRSDRNALLENSDWSQASDIPSDIKNKWTSYRQNLRDLPAQSGFPNSVTWPTKP